MIEITKKDLIALSSPVKNVETERRKVETKKNIGIALVLIIILYVIGTFVYYNVEGWVLLDSVYFMTTTFTTVGYGDIVQKTEFGKVFTILIILVGISTSFFLLYSIMAYREIFIDTRIESSLK